ncbi:polysaccharide deacetylase family protein [Mycolicibacterium sp.]|uniref:polysaccharide deacetylase family protein n=1 Tax=Mycolicibacterium sp. TaxID=2320850 RepID=UPI001A226ED8|nr:polysaccharide deacetylase family protein [Mycolicibacterium sp.]MBJ7340262.1 polysaccharide deacetylase family protein [Mycolicibacterium sp.]
MSRRNVLMGVVASAAGIALVRCGADASSQAAQVPAPPTPVGPPPPPTWPELLPPPPAQARMLLPGGGVLSALPGSGDLMSLTLDDGVDTGVVRAYCQLAKDTGLRLTMFVTGVYSSWTDNRELLLPLVESGQIQLGNHTWIHPDLTKLTGSRIADELRHTDQFIANTFGVDATPFYRPPYGAYNDLVQSVAADLGYTETTLWNGNMGDDQILRPQDIVANADKYYVPQSVVIGHLNHPPVTSVYHQLIDVIHDRRLRTVTLNDVFLKPEASRLTSAYPD